MISTLGIYIKNRLSELTQTQTWVAEKMGVSINAVSKWIKTGKIGRDNFFSLVALLGSEGAPRIDEIVEAEARKKSDYSILSEQELDLISAFRALDDIKRGEALLGVKWELSKKQGEEMRSMLSSQGKKRRSS